MPALWSTSLYPAGGTESFVSVRLWLSWVICAAVIVGALGSVVVVVPVPVVVVPVPVVVPVEEVVCVLVVKFSGQVTFVPARLAIKLTLS